MNDLLYAPPQLLLVPSFFPNLLPARKEAFLPHSTNGVDHAEQEVSAITEEPTS
jgi:hypothetical protein